MKELFNIAGRVALVTGGSRGIGAMIATGFVENGVRTYITARNASACDAMAKRLSSRGECISVPADLSTQDGLQSVCKVLGERERALHILVNNAGANWSADLGEFPEAGWDKVMTINLKSPFFLVQGLLPLLERGASHDAPARIINVGSIDGLHCSEFPTFSYGASKAGMHHLTRMLAARLASRHINVNAIAPGPFESKMMAHTLATQGEKIVSRVPRRRIGIPEDMAGAALFLAAPASSYVTGIVLPVDGGITGAL